MPTHPSEQGPTSGSRTDKGRGNRFRLEVPVQLEEGSASCTGVTKNLGPGGVFVATVRTFGVGARVTLTLKVQANTAPIAAVAQVRWCRPFTDLDDQPAGVGLKFIDTPLHAAILAKELRRRFMGLDRSRTARGGHDEDDRERA